ncbi:MAG: glycosyltransferase [Sulfolobaceae archaeon]|nr:glycosyltransferase [Sulfolobales archaeon]
MREIPDWVELLLSLTSLIFAVQLALIFLLSSRYSDPSTNMSPLSPSAKGFKTAAVVPVYGEDENVFERVIVKLTRLFDRVIVVGDGVSEPYRSIALAHGAEFHSIPRSGKRGALEYGVSLLRDEKYVALVDSDTDVPDETYWKSLAVLESGYDALTVRITYKGDNLTARAQDFLGYYNDVLNRAFARLGKVYVLNGQFSVYRAVKLREIIAGLSSRKLLGKLIVVGDDKELTSRAHRAGLRLAYLSSAEAVTYGASSLITAIKQLLRWTRSGYLYLFLDLMSLNYRRGFLYYIAGMDSVLYPIFGAIVTALELTYPHHHHHILINLNDPFLWLVMEWTKELLAILGVLPKEPRLFVAFVHKPFVNDSTLLLAGALKLAADLLTTSATLGFVMQVLPKARDDPKGALVSLGLLGIQGLLSIYSLITLYRVSSWLTRGQEPDKRSK